MIKTERSLIAIPICFTVLVFWFAWSAFKTASPIANENLRGAGLTISAAIEQLVVADPSFRSLARYSTADIAYFTLINTHGIISFHTNPRLIGQSFAGVGNIIFPDGISEDREQLGTGEEAYLLRTKIHTAHEEYLLVLALHTYRADQVIRRATTGITVVAMLTAALWGLTVILIFTLRREERYRRNMHRREELARLGEMGAVMAHEIRNPLAGIKGFAQLSVVETNLEKAHGYAEKIVTQSLRMEALVNDLLAFARDDQAERQLIDLSDLITDCVAITGFEAESGNVEIQVDISSQVKINAVTDRIVQMHLNLIKNAIQAMPGGGILKIELRQNKGSVHIVFTDSGTGISPEQLEHIFEPFWTSKVNGTGLGLSLCRKVAEEHGGSLSVESRLGVGTKFIVSLPVAK